MQWSHVLTIGRVELRRRWRALKGNQLQLAMLALGGVFVMLFSAAGLFGLYFAGSVVAAGEAGDAVGGARTVGIYAWVFSAGFSAYLLIVRGLEPDHVDGLLTTVSHREVVGGLVVSEALVWAGPTVGFGLLASISFALGAGSLATVPLALGAICAVVAFGLVTGFAVALGVKNSGARSVLLTRLRTLFAVALGLAYAWAIVTNSFGSILDPLYTVLSPTPLAWYGDLALIAVSEDASLLRGAGAVVFTAVGIGLALAAVSRLAGWLWYAEPVRIDRVASTATAPGRASRLSQWLAPGTYGVMVVDWKRARRAPITLSFVLYPLIVLFDPVATAFRTGTIPGSLPLFVALSGAWATGSAFALNVLGNEGAVLPVTVLGVSSGRPIVSGHVLAGASIGVPVTVLSTVALGLAGPQSLGAVATLGLTALVLAAAAGPIATGIGTVFPRFERARVSRSREAIVPSMFAFLVYTFVVVVAAGPGLLAHTALVGRGLADLVGVGPAVVGGIGLIATSLVALPAGYLSIRRAFRAVETFQYD